MPNGIRDFLDYILQLVRLYGVLRALPDPLSPDEQRALPGPDQAHRQLFHLERLLDLFHLDDENDPRDPIPGQRAPEMDPGSNLARRNSW